MTAQKYVLSAQIRTLLGKKAKKLRAEGKLLAHVYGKAGTNVNLSLDQKEFVKIYQKAGETGLVQLHVEGEDASRPVLISGVEFHPVTGAILHVDLYQVNLREKVSASIPVEAIGESEAVKNGGILVLAVSEIEVEALPTDLPEKFVIDLSALAIIGDTITVESLVYDKEKVTIALESDMVLATVQEQQAEEVVPETAEPVEVELTKQGATKEEVEGEAAAAQ